ncbi:hypothetical protein A3I48_00130 [Candidatus Daviesbacteria bacterium RIFCSPLOWO2_02_FULL_36_7]|uniref:Uncharacterized protein n=1 Tax=Candidatus Daviesbacteria bacterium RIFCSPLOWO2_02_FULL_36_7 TaxID=1797792 RepID=A0A1F5MHC3_9BACT|nr:MAG: hypothetical protein A3I48_00130 [Candidatus Daviesbacteria bacterium RIFCSPLOWO2_02_FULL_36_7]
MSPEAGREIENFQDSVEYKVGTHFMTAIVYPVDLAVSLGINPRRFVKVLRKRGLRAIVEDYPKLYRWMHPRD